MRISNIGTIQGNSKLPGITPPIFTPGGRKLPPLGLSPGGGQNPDTPGHMWLSLLHATGNGQDRGKLGLTPNESNLRLGLTPGAVGQANGGGFPFPTGMTTPLVLMQGNPMTPGLLTLLGLGPGAEQEKKEVSVEDDVKSESGEVSKKRAAKAPTESKKRQRTRKKEPAPKADDGEEEKRKSFLERNRVAASKCRQRKKQLIQKMEDELNFYSTGYRELSAQVGQLRDQLMKITLVVMGHKECQMLLQQVGGFEQLNQLVRDSQFVSNISNQGNVTLIPLTIPTTLNSVGAGQVAQAVLVPLQSQTFQQAMPAMIEQGVPRLAVMATEPAPVTSHGSMTDLQLVGGEQSDLRTIQLMLNMQRPGELEGLTLDMGMVQPNN